jgi:hypothetical protein
LKLKILLLVLVFIGIFTSVCIYDKEEIYFPEDYDLSYEKLQQENPVIAVRDLCLNNTNFQQPTLPTDFPNPTVVLGHFSKVGKTTDNIKEETNDLLFKVISAIRDVCIGAEENETIKLMKMSICSALPDIQASCLTICFVGSFVYDNKAREIIESVNDPLAESNKGLNEILKEIYTKRRELYCRGGGYKSD